MSGKGAGPASCSASCPGRSCGGAVQEVAPGPELLPRALALATTIAAKSLAAVRAIRGSFGTVEALPSREGFGLEQRYTDRLSSSAEAAEARHAFLGKKQPS